MNISDVETVVRLVSGVVSSVSGGLTIVSWLRSARPDVADQMLRDLERIAAADFPGWVDSFEFPEEHGPGYVIYVYHETLDDWDRIEIREPGPWRADGVDRLRKILSIDLR